MGQEQDVTLLLERAAGPNPGDGDIGDVRRRLRRQRRRRRVGTATGVVAALAASLLAAGQRGSGDDGGAVVAGPPQPGVVLFERQLVEGTTLRVSVSDHPGEVVVEVTGAGEPVALPVEAGTITVRIGDEALPWDLAAMVRCPGDETFGLQAWQDDGGRDRMPMIDGLAVVAMPRALPEGDVPPQVPLPGDDVDGDGDGVLRVEDADGDGLFEVDGVEVDSMPSLDGWDPVFVDFVDTAGNTIRPGAMLTPSDVQHGTTTEIPIGSVDGGQSELIPGPDDPANPCG